MDTVVTTLDSLVDQGRLPGWAVAVADEAGTVIRTGGHRTPAGDPVEADTPFAIASCSKPVAALLTLRLVERGVLALEDPVARWLPELATPRVLAGPRGDLDDTVPARTPITVEHLLTMTAGFGWVSEGPLAEAMARAQVAPGPFPPPMGPDEYLARLAALPLADEPGTTWRYHTSSDVLGVLLARATGRSLTDLLDEHVLAPLDITQTGFTADPERLARVDAPREDGGLRPYAIPEGTFTEPPPFESLATGLVAPIGDLARLARALTGHGPSILSEDSFRELRRPRLAEGQRAMTEGMLEPESSWGLHVEVRPDGLIGWAGGLGTIAYADPRTGRAAALATLVTVDGPGTAAAFETFWSLLREA